MRKRLWSPDEDEKLQNYVSQHGFGNWSEVAKKTGLQRCGKSCRLRWINYLRPDLKRGKFSAEEKLIIVNLQKVFGNSWSKIAAHLPGRTDSDIKNFWHSHFRKKRPPQIMNSAALPNSHQEPVSAYNINNAYVFNTAYVFNSAAAEAIARNPNTCMPAAGLAAPFINNHHNIALINPHDGFCTKPDNYMQIISQRSAIPPPASISSSMPCLEDEIQLHAGKHHDHDRHQGLISNDSELMGALSHNNAANSYNGSKIRGDRVISGDFIASASSKETSVLHMLMHQRTTASNQAAPTPPEGLDLVVWSCVNRTSQTDQEPIIPMHNMHTINPLIS